MKIKLPRRTRVYIPNRGHHDFSTLEKYGDLVYLTERSVNKLLPNNIARQIEDALEDAEEKDYIVISSLSVLCSVICAIFTHKFGRLNLLIHDDRSPTPGVYVMRQLVFGQGAQPQTEKVKNDRNGKGLHRA